MSKDLLMTMGYENVWSEHYFTLLTPLSGDTASMQLDVSGTFVLPLNPTHQLRLLYDVNREQSSSLGSHESSTSAMGGLHWQWKPNPQWHTAISALAVQTNYDGCELDDGETSCYHGALLTVGGAVKVKYRHGMLQGQATGNFSETDRRWTGWRTRLQSQLDLPISDTPFLGADRVLVNGEYEYRDKLAKGYEQRVRGAIGLTWNATTSLDASANVAVRYDVTPAVWTVTPSVGIMYHPNEVFTLMAKIFFGEPDFVANNQ